MKTTNHSYRSAKLFCIKFFIILMMVSVAFSKSFAASKPNVLIIISDDLNIDPSCYGNSTVNPLHTPNIDALAASGMLFDRAYCQYPLCNPSRTSFLTGLRPETTKIWDNKTDPLNLFRTKGSLPQYFKDNGYYTVGIGKVTHFDEDIVWSEPLYDAWQFNHMQALKDKYKKNSTDDWAPIPTSEILPDQQHASRAIQALQQRAAQPGTPFFMVVGFHLPHVPIIAHQQYFDQYPRDQIQLPFTPQNDRSDIPSIALKGGGKDETGAQADMIGANQAYFAGASEMDVLAGQVLQELDQLNLSSNTIVLFMSDHGFQLGEHADNNGKNGLWQKNCLFQESTHVPLIVSVPGKTVGKCSQLIEYEDIYPTLAELCGLSVPPTLEGTSFAKLLDQPTLPWKKGVFTMVNHGATQGKSVQNQQYRYTEWGTQFELYDTQNDPHEFTNLANNPNYTSVRNQMKALLTGGWKGALPPP
jgi:iduronate 2-sulfatase